MFTQYIPIIREYNTLHRVGSTYIIYEQVISQNSYIVNTQIIIVIIVLFLSILLILVLVTRSNFCFQGPGDIIMILKDRVLSTSSYLSSGNDTQAVKHTQLYARMDVHVSQRHNYRNK